MDIRKVLLVDDDPCIRRIAQYCLEKIGNWEVVMAVNGQDAWQAADREQPDIILLDVRLPDMDGPATLAKLKGSNNTAHIPVVFMTARVQKNEIEEYCRLRVLGVIAKPFDPLTLAADIQLIFAKHHSSNAA